LKAASVPPALDSGKVLFQQSFRTLCRLGPSAHLVHHPKERAEIEGMVSGLVPTSPFPPFVRILQHVWIPPLPFNHPESWR
jgi:hypothetical protein